MLNDFVDLLIDPKDYTVIKSLGDGNFGSVMKVKDKKNQVYALKKSKQSNLSFSLVKYFLSEIATISSINHPAVIKLDGFVLPRPEISSESENNLFNLMLKQYNINPDDVQYVEGVGSYLLTPFLKGDNLQKYILEEKPPKVLNPTQKMKIMASLCSGIAHLHSKHILHRDLKLENILMTEDLLPKLADFGFSRFFVDNEEKPMTFVGTPSYMAPEIHDNAPANASMDVFSLGCILYEIITNKPHVTVELFPKFRCGLYRPDFPDDTNPYLIEMINIMWDQKPENRITAYNAFQLLSKKEYYLDGTNAEEYMKYYRELDICTEPESSIEFKICKRIADSGDRLEQYNMSLYYLNNETGIEFKEISLIYLELSAEQNYPPALYDLALIYKTIDPKKSFSLMLKAASLLNIKALYKLGHYYIKGIGINQYTAHGEKYLKDAGRLGYQKAYLYLSKCRFNGKYIREDLSQSKNYFDKINKDLLDPKDRAKYDELGTNIIQKLNLRKSSK